MDASEVLAAWERAAARAPAVGAPAGSAGDTEERHGSATFIGAPAAAGVEELEGATAAVLGIPCAASDPDVADGPGAIRRASMAFSSRDRLVPGPWRDELPEAVTRLRLIDDGDVATAPDDVETTFMRAHEKVADILAASAVPIVFGGDHSVTIPVLQVLAGKLAGRLGIVVFDGRLDLGFAPRYGAGSQWARAFELGVVEADNFVEIGVRDVPASHPERLVADELGIHVFTVAEVDELGIVAVAQEALEMAGAGTEALYLSVDIDVVDASDGGLAPSGLAGLSARELLRAVRTLASGRVAGFDVCGVAPRRDAQGRLARVAAAAALEVLAGIAAQRP